MKFLYYSPVPWPHLKSGFDSFPHTNQQFNPIEGVELYRSALELFVEAERAGFDWLGVGEEHMNAYGVVPNPTLIAAALASMTTHAFIAILGNPLPLLNPVRVAEEYAMIDILSGGRLISGFPRGVPQNYAAYNLDSSNSREKLAEAISLVRKAWNHPGPFSWSSPHYEFPAVSIWPQPIQEDPRIVLSCKTEESVRLAVEHRATIAEIFVRDHAVLSNFEVQMSTYLRLANENGWEPSLDNFALSVPCVIAASDELARDKAARALNYQRTRLSGSFESQKAGLSSTYYAGSQFQLQQREEDLGDRISYGGIICGKPDSVIEQIRQLTSRFAIGTLGLQMQFGDLSHDEVFDSINLFAAHVRDHVRERNNG